MQTNLNLSLQSLTVISKNTCVCVRACVYVRACTCVRVYVCVCVGGGGGIYVHVLVGVFRC